MPIWRRGLLRKLDYFVSVGFPFIDFLTVYSAAYLAVVSSGRFAEGVSSYYELAIFFGALVVPAWFGRLGIYGPWRGQPLFLEIRKISIAWFAFFAGLAVLALATQTGADFSRVWLAHTVIISWLGLVLSRLLVRKVLNTFRARGYNTRFVVVVGDPGRCDSVVEQLAAAKWSGLKVIAKFELADKNALSELAKLFNTRQVDQLWLAMDINEVDKINAVQAVAAPFPVQVMWSPDLVGVHLLNHRITDVAGMPVVALQDRPLSGVASLLKVLEDRVLAAAILLAMAVPMALIAAAIKLTSAGPVLFSQKRHGISGETINVLKFRSMRVHAESGVITSASKGDARITPLGKFLRSTSLDELPQFFNVLRGEMSIVGPRPHSITQEKLFTDYYHLYPMRHKIKPGITGWAQVNGLRGEITSPEKLRQRVEHDIYYLRNWSLWLDLYIIVRTAIKGWSGTNAY